MTEQVVSEHLDVAIVVNPITNPDLVVKEICRDEVCLWQVKKNLNPDVLIIEPGLLQTRDILHKMNKSGLTFKRMIESSSLEVIASLVTQGVGCGILPTRVLQSLGAERYEKLPRTPVFQDKICLIYKPEFRKSKRGKAFIEAFANAVY